MSAIRRSTHNRASRANQLPYARPQHKTSSWSIAGFLSYLNPLRARMPIETNPDSSDDSDDSQESSHLPHSPAMSLNRRGHQMARDKLTLETPHSAPPCQQPSEMTLSPSQPCPPSPTNHLETVSAHLKESLGTEGVEKLVSLLQKGPSVEDSEPFRFSTSPSTPARGNSPCPGTSNGFGFTFGASSAQVPTPSPRKTLNRNPNGVYRWQGGGSAKTPRSKNRYSSPAFGPSRSTPDRLVLGDTQTRPETSKTDTKRRKVGDGAEDSSSRPSGSVSDFPTRSVAPEPSPTRAKQPVPFPVTTTSPATPRTRNGITPNTNPLPSTSRLRIPPIPQKPTAPVIPSPLRQAWSGGSPPSQPDKTLSTPAPPKQTKAANFMTELIKEVTPPKRPDLSNPYQAASPVKKVNATKVRVGKRVRATGKPSAPTVKDDKDKSNKVEQDKTKVYSTQAIIEATLPKGSKRSRPPSHFEKPSLPASPPEERLISVSSDNKRPLSQSKLHAAYVVEEVDEDLEEAERPNKKSKGRSAAEKEIATPNGKGRTPLSASDMLIEEIEEVDAGITVEKPQSVTFGIPQPSSGTISPTISGRPSYPNIKSKSTSAPKEPSKLRFSYQPESSGSPVPPLPPLPSAPSTFSIPVVPLPLKDDKDEVINDTKTTLVPARQAALTVPTQTLPTYSFTLAVYSLPSSTSHLKTRHTVEILPKSSLPTFDFSEEPLRKPAPSTSSIAKAFDWAAAGVKPPSTSEAVTTWTCSTCMLSNPASATDKCIICDSPRPDSNKPVSSVKPFDWAAAGVKPATAANAGSTWTCSTCMLSNPASAKDKCTVCDTPR